MLIKAKKIINNKVFTQSGHFLGKVVDFEVDSLSQYIKKYYVSEGFFDFPKSPLVVNAEQVIEIKKEKIIVEDAVVSEKTVEKKAATGVEYAK